MNLIINSQMNFISRLFENFRKVYSSFRDNIWGVNLGDMQSLSKYNKGIKYLLYAIDLLSKYAWVVPSKDKKRTVNVTAFQKIISKGRKPNKTWVDQGSKFYDNPFKRFLKINNIEMKERKMKGNLLLLKDLLEHWKTRWQLFQTSWQQDDST